ncbi:MAG TPA: PEGA domain-containing protein, partial [Anaeromyxobacter sp.]
TPACPGAPVKNTRRLLAAAATKYHPDGLSRPERFSTVAPLPPHGEWRRVLALDRSGAQPHAVVLAFAPQGVVEDPSRLAGLVRDVEAAGRLHHPSAMPVLGTETVGDALAIVEAYRPGVSLRALLDAGGRLPPDVAVRIAVDACAAVARAHAVDAGDGRKLVHGAIAPSRIAVGEDGAAIVLGFGTGTAAGPAQDVRALAAVLHECLAGEAPGPGASGLDEAGVPAALAAAVGRALGAPPGAEPSASASAFAEAVAAAGPIASHADVAAYVDAILPADEGARGELARALASATAGDAEEVSEDYIVEPTDPGVRPPSAEPTPEPLPRPPATRPGADPVGVFAAPTRLPERSHAPAIVAVVCAAVGFGAGFAASRLDPGASTGAGAPQAAAPADAPARPIPSAAPPPEKGTLPTPAAAKAAITTRPPTRAAAPKPHAAPPKRPARAAAKPGKAAEAPAGKGMLHVAAPAEAEVFLDERRIGKGNVHLEVPEGAHRIEVRLGEARVAERFTLAAGETWTYDVTPTP